MKPKQHTRHRQHRASREVGIRGIAKFFLLVFALVLLVACSGTFLEVDQPADLTPLKLGLSTFPGTGPFFIAVEKEFCRQEGLDLEVIMNDDNSFQLAQLQSGEIDVYVDTNNRLVFTNESGVDVVAFLPANYSDGADGVVTSSDVGSVADLSQQKVPIGIDITDTSFFLLMARAVEEGLGPDDFNIVQMESSAAITAFITGEVEAAGSYEPWLSKGLDREGAHLLLTSHDIPGAITDVLITSPSLAREKQDEFISLARCWFAAVDYIETNPEESIEIMAQVYEISSDEMAEFAGMIAWPSQTEAIEYLQGGAMMDLIELSSDLYYQLDLLERPVEDPQSMIYEGIVDGLE
jgi:NitT/TauT family transport system substrate-binding protein